MGCWPNNTFLTQKKDRAATQAGPLLTQCWPLLVNMLTHRREFVSRMVQHWAVSSIGHGDEQRDIRKKSLSLIMFQWAKPCNNIEYKPSIHTIQQYLCSPTPFSRLMNVWRFKLNVVSASRCRQLNKLDINKPLINFKKFISYYLWSNQNIALVQTQKEEIWQLWYNPTEECFW